MQQEEAEVNTVLLNSILVEDVKRDKIPVDTCPPKSLAEWKKVKQIDAVDDVEEDTKQENCALELPDLEPDSDSKQV